MGYIDNTVIIKAYHNATVGNLLALQSRLKQCNATERDLLEKLLEDAILSAKNARFYYNQEKGFTSKEESVKDGK